MRCLLANGELRLVMIITNTRTNDEPRLRRANLCLGVWVSKFNCLGVPNLRFDLTSLSGSGGYILNSLFSSRFVHEPCKNAKKRPFWAIFEIKWAPVSTQR